MNKKKLRYLPIIIYTLLPAILWIYSVTANIISLLASDKSTQTDEPSISIRWFLSSSAESISSLPWGGIMLILMSAGMLQTSGLIQSTLHACRKQVRSKRTRSALISAGIAFALSISLLLVAALQPWSLFSSITGGFTDSPLQDGWLLLLYLMTAATTIVFGIVAGTYRSVDDIIKGASHRIALHAHSLISLIPAALFISMSNNLEYTIFSHPIAEYTFLLLPFLCDIYTEE